MSTTLNSKIFSECLHSIFEILRLPAETVSLELISVIEKNYSSKLEQFSLIFRGSMTPVLSQHIYALRHEKLGDLSLFLVPIGANSEGMCYEAVFNRFSRDGPVEL